MAGIWYAVIVAAVIDVVIWTLVIREVVSLRRAVSKIRQSRKA